MFDHQIQLFPWENFLLSGFFISISDNFLHNFVDKQSGLSACSLLKGWSPIKSLMFRFEVERWWKVRGEQSYKVRKQMRNSWTYLAAEDPGLPAIFFLLCQKQSWEIQSKQKINSTVISPPNWADLTEVSIMKIIRDWSEALRGSGGGLDCPDCGLLAINWYYPVMSDLSLTKWVTHHCSISHSIPGF